MPALSCDRDVLGEIGRIPSDPLINSVSRGARHAHSLRPCLLPRVYKWRTPLCVCRYIRNVCARIRVHTRDVDTVIASHAYQWSPLALRLRVHVHARLQACGRPVHARRRPTLYRQGIHMAVYVRAYTYNLTIHITMYTFWGGTGGGFAPRRGWYGGDRGRLCLCVSCV